MLDVGYLILDIPYQTLNINNTSNIKKKGIKKGTTLRSSLFNQLPLTETDCNSCKTK